MKKHKTLFLVLGAVIVIGGLAGLGWYFYQSVNFFSTDNAQVTADMITVIPQVAGKLTSWNVNVGDSVKAGQVLGTQDVSTMVTSTATNPQTLANAAGSIIENAEIRSPIDGEVVQNDVISGQVVSPSTDLATIADTSHFYILANIEETSILRIKQGQAVDIHIDAYPHRDFQGYVETIEPATQTAFSPLPNLNTSGTYSKVTQLIPVKIEMADVGNLELMLGMNAEVKIHVR
ncbi:MAG TPA: efflux RND transporter periplasmic adaptor subunit [Spirochaetia bacterium]|nr:efflux RND transporter periplasmic adaptor subunit [Spirochaetia bacterium]